MTVAELRHQSGHYFRPNGVGDYTLVCPTLGEVEGFVPFMLARCAAASAVCNACGETIGARVEDATA